MRKKVLLAITIISLLTLSACSTLPFGGKPSFVKVNGQRLEFDGKPYYFTGTNIWYGCYLGSKGEMGDRERIVRELDNLKGLGITNLRILAASEETDIQNSLKPSIQKKPGVYDEDLLEGLDYLLDAMNKRDMKAVLYLNNFWNWTGGMPQYCAWADSIKTPDPNDPSIGWGNYQNVAAAFYRNQKANELFRKFILDIATRKNKINDLYYYKDPTIMAWQLANEPRPGTGEEAMKNAASFYNWIDETAKYIHSIDPNHLVTTGNEGTMGSANSEEIYLNAHKSPYIDFMTFHLWPKNWSWFDAKRIDSTYPSTVEKAVSYIKQHIEFARKLNKPTTMEEFGLPRDKENFNAQTPTTARDKYFSTILALVYDSASAGAPIAGTNFWAWGGEGRGKNEDGTWRKGDPLTGDPFGEGQGLNSVFNTDTTTLRILSNHARLMKELCERKDLIKTGKDQITSK